MRFRLDGNAYAYQQLLARSDSLFAGWPGPMALPNATFCPYCQHVPGHCQVRTAKNGSDHDPYLIYPDDWAHDLLHCLRQSDAAMVQSRQETDMPAAVCFQRSP